MCTKINRSLDKAISTLGMELTASKTTSQIGGQHLKQQHGSNHSIQKAFVVIGINTAFSSKKRRDSIRETWLPNGTYTYSRHDVIVASIHIKIQRFIFKFY